MCDALSAAGCAACSGNEPCCAHAACQETGEQFRPAGAPPAPAFHDAPRSPARRRGAYETYDAFDALYGDPYTDGYDAAAAAAESLYAGAAGEGYGDEQRDDSATAAFALADAQREAWLAELAAWNFFPSCAECEAGVGCACEGCAGRRPRRASSCPPAIRLSAWHGGDADAQRADVQQAEAQQAHRTQHAQHAQRDQLPQRTCDARPAAQGHPEPCARHPRCEHRECGGRGISRGEGTHDQQHCGHHRHEQHFGFGSYGPLGFRGGLGHFGPFGHRGGFGHHGPFGPRWGFGFYGPFSHRGGFGFQGLFSHRGGFKHFGPLGYRGGFGHRGPFGHGGGFGFNDLFGHRGGFGHHGPFGHRGGLGHHGPFGHLSPFSHRGGFAHHGPFGHRGGFGFPGLLGHRGGFGHHGPFGSFGGFGSRGPFGHRGGFGPHGSFVHRGGFSHRGMFDNQEGFDHLGAFGHRGGFDYHRGPFVHPGSFGHHGPSEHSGGFRHPDPFGGGAKFHHHSPFSERGDFGHEPHGPHETHHRHHGSCKRRKHCGHQRSPCAAHSPSHACSPRPGEDSLSEPCGAWSARCRRRSGCGCGGRGRFDSQAPRTPATGAEDVNVAGEEVEETAAAEAVPEAQAEPVVEGGHGTPRRRRLLSCP